MRKNVITVLIMIPVLAVLFSLAMRWLEPRLIYFPGPPPSRTPADAGLRFEDVQFPTQDGHTLKGWWLPAREADAPVMLYFHGNAGTREDRLEILQGMMSAGISVFIFDYRGYGGSSGRPSEAGLILDGEAAFDWLDGKTNGGPIFLLGHSLGGAVAAQTALTRKSAGLILESAFTSVPEMARRTLPLPQVLLRMLVKTRFDNRAALRQYKGPLLILHGDMDEVVPFCEQVGIRIPAHFDTDQQRYVLDYDLPILLDEETGKWDFGGCTWEEKFKQWKKGGPTKIEAFERLQNEVWGDDLW